VASGTVLSLHRWPVKSMGGEAHAALGLDERGVLGDRERALFDVARGRRLTAREAPRMLLWAARGDGTVTAPDGRTFAWEEPALVEALTADLGREVARRRDPGLLQDLPRSVLVTTRATHEAVEGALGPLDLRRWRTNIHLELDAEAFAEEGWEGAELHVGEARLALLHPCERCVIPTRDPDTAAKHPEILRWLARERRTLFGVNARPLGPATVRTGDRVHVVQAPTI
jgi:uncharacterized protein YcbX